MRQSKINREIKDSNTKFSQTFEGASVTICVDSYVMKNKVNSKQTIWFKGVIILQN